MSKTRPTRDIWFSKSHFSFVVFSPFRATVFGVCQRTAEQGYCWCSHSVVTVGRMKTAPRWRATAVLAAAAAAAVFLLVVVEGRPNQVMTPGEHSLNSPFVRRRSSGITRRSTTTPDILRQHLKQVIITPAQFQMNAAFFIDSSINIFGFWFLPFLFLIGFI